MRSHPFHNLHLRTFVPKFTIPPRPSPLIPKIFFRNPKIFRIFAFPTKAHLHTLVLRNMHRITTIFSKALITLACAIILVHAVVPHHHHDCCGTMGIVFEDEVSCHCHSNASPCQACHSHSPSGHHHTDSQHPFDLCKLQELLSHLVLSNKDQKTYLAVATIAVHDLLVALVPVGFSSEGPAATISLHNYYSPQSALPITFLRAAVPLRAPPQC